MKESQNEMGTDANIQPNHSVMIYPEKEMQHKGTHLSAFVHSQRGLMFLKAKFGGCKCAAADSLI